MGYFFDRFESDSLNKLYELLADVTPLRYDCGALCGAACCKGDEKDGMILFPGERGWYEGREGFTIRHNAEYDYDYLVCRGECDRDERPLSCRIYPYFFYRAEDGGVTAAPDVRALGRCPLAGTDIPADKTFLRRMRMGAKVIVSDEEMLAFVTRLSALFTDFGKLI